MDMVDMATGTVMDITEVSTYLQIILKACRKRKKYFTNLQQNQLLNLFIFSSFFSIITSLWAQPWPFSLHKCQQTNHARI